MSKTVSIDAMRPEFWEAEVYRNVMDNLYFTQNGMMGKGKNVIVELKDQLKKSKGDTITFALTAKHNRLSGVSGDGELEGQENARVAYSESVAIDQIRFAERLTGQLDEQKNAFDMRMDAVEKLSMQKQEFIEQQIFFKLGGCLNTSLTDITGTALGFLKDGTTSAMTWSNSPTQIPAADTLAGYGDRYLCADYTNGAASLSTSDLLTPELISRIKVKAATASPKIIPIRIGGKAYYILFVHSWQAFDLKNNSTYTQAQREAQVRGNENPIFTGALGIWDNVILHEHEYVPFLDISVAGNNFAASAAGTDFSADCFRSILCGQQAIAFAEAQNKNGWVEKTFNYENEVGFATGMIGGLDKTMFNSKEYGVVILDTSATSLV